MRFNSQLSRMYNGGASELADKLDFAPLQISEAPLKVGRKYSREPLAELCVPIT
jgi:hypothetical protein